MSYQVNFRLFVPDCAYWEAEAIAKLSEDFRRAAEEIIMKSVIPKQVGISSGEVTFLNK